MLLLVAGLARADNRIESVQSQVGDGHIRISIKTRQTPVYSVYQLRAPDRLVVDFIDTDAAYKLGKAPLAKVVRGWSLETVGISRARLVVGLGHRLAPDSLSVKADSSGLLVDFVPYYRREETIALTPAVKWVQREEALPSGYLYWNQLEVDPNDPGVSLDIGLAKERLDSRETTSSMVARTGALAGVNGGFFASAGGPLGLVVKAGQVLAPHVSRRPPRTVLGVTSDRKVQFNRVVVARGRQLESRDGGSWDGIQLALGGGPRLLHRGKVALTTDDEELGPKGNDITRVAGRTAVATTRDGKLLIVTASGYHDNHREGLVLGEMARRLVQEGADEAMNLDGGASVTMVVGSQVVSDGPGNASQEKAVATALMVRDDRRLAYPAGMTVQAGNSRLPGDGASSTTITAQISDPSGKPVPDGTPVRFYGSKVGVEPGLVKTSNGQATAKVTSSRLVGQGGVRVECGGLMASESIYLLAGRPASLAYRLGSGTAVKGQAEFQAIPFKAELLDEWGNPVAGQAVTLAVAGSEVEARQTDNSGLVAAELVLPVAGGQVTVRSPGVPDLTFTAPALSE